MKVDHEKKAAIYLVNWQDIKNEKKTKVDHEKDIKSIVRNKLLKAVK